MAASNPFRGESRSLQVRLFVLYLLFVIYGSLVPLRYVDRDWVDALDAFSHIPFLELGIQSRSDWVANFLLFVPLTFLAGMVLNRTDGVFSRLLVALALMVLAVGLAFGIEFTQLFFPQRTVSQNDILAEGLGGILGSTLHLVAGARAQVWLDGFWREQQAQDRATILLRSYLLVLLLFNVLPLDLTLSPVEIFHKWKEGRLLFVPFSGLTDGWSTGLYSVITDLLIWVPVGALWAVGSCLASTSHYVVRLSCRSRNRGVAVVRVQSHDRRHRRAAGGMWHACWGCVVKACPSLVATHFRPHQAMDVGLVERMGDAASVCVLVSLSISLQRVKWCRSGDRIYPGTLFDLLLWVGIPCTQ
jgi:VanZ family protein